MADARGGGGCDYAFWLAVGVACTRTVGWYSSSPRIPPNSNETDT